MPVPEPPMLPVLAVRITLVPVTVPFPLTEFPFRVTELVVFVPIPAVLIILTLPALALSVMSVPPIAPVPLVPRSPDVVVTCNVLATVVLLALNNRAWLFVT